MLPVDTSMLWQMLRELRHDLDGHQRDRIASLLAGIVNGHVPPSPVAPSALVEAVTRRLSAEGHCAIGNLLQREQVAAVVAHFRSRHCFNSHVPVSSDGIPRLVGDGAEAFHYGCYLLQDIVDAPFLIELANDPQILSIAESYLGCTPTLYSLNAWWSFPGFSQAATFSQSFHRDIDDFRFCTLFVYLTDVDGQGGPHVYVRRTHRPDLLAEELARAGAAGLDRLDPRLREAVAGGAMRQGEGYGLDAAVLGLLGHLAETVEGPAGSGLIADTHGFHKGLPPERGPRLIFWSRYGLHVNENPGSPRVEGSQIASRIPWNDRAGYINRALIRT